jgi:hypothetical protein
MADNAKLSRRLQIIIVAAALLQFDAALAQHQLPGFEANYKVRYGILRGQMSLELDRLDAGYAYRTSLRPRGVASWLRSGEIRETSSLESIDGLIRPRDYVSSDTISRPNRYAKYVFDEPPGRITGEYKSRTVDAPMRANGHNRISAHVAIMHALQSSIPLTTIAVFDRGRWRDFKFDVLPGQAVETPAGRFDTTEVRYASVKKQKSWSLHCAEALNYLPVLIVYSENGKIKSRAELLDYQIIDRASSDRVSVQSGRAHTYIY